MTNNENLNYCKAIAEELKLCTSGNAYRCPRCGEIISFDNDQYDKETTLYACQECGKEFEENELVAIDLYDYFDNVYDVEYRIDQHKEYKSVSVMVGCGGPNIYIDTGTRSVNLCWWNETASYPLNSNICNAIDDYFEELYLC